MPPYLDPDTCWCWPPSAETPPESWCTTYVYSVQSCFLSPQLFFCMCVCVWVELIRIFCHSHAFSPAFPALKLGHGRGEVAVRGERTSRGGEGSIDLSKLVLPDSRTHTLTRTHSAVHISNLDTMCKSIFVPSLTLP